MGMVLGRAVEDEEAGPDADRVGRGRRDTGPRGSSKRASHDAERGLVVLADDQQVVAALAAEQGRGRVLDRDGVADPGLGRSRRRRARPGRRAAAREQGVARQVGRGVALEDDRRARQDRLAAPGQLVELLQVRLAALVGEPDDLEEVVPLGRAVGVVVDRLAGPGEHLRRPMFFSLRIRWASVSLH